MNKFEELNELSKDISRQKGRFSNILNEWTHIIESTSSRPKSSLGPLTISMTTTGEMAPFNALQFNIPSQLCVVKMEDIPELIQYLQKFTEEE